MSARAGEADHCTVTVVAGVKRRIGSTVAVGTGELEPQSRVPAARITHVAAPPLTTSDTPE